MRSRGATNTVRKKALAAKYGVTPKKTPTQPQPQPQARAETTGQRGGPPQAAAQTTAKRMEEVANEERIIADNTAQKITSTDLLGREVKEDIIGVDDNDEHKEGLRGVAEGLLAPTSQIAQMPKDVLQGVATEDQRMQTSWIDLLITPAIAPILAAPQLGLTSREYYNPLALAPRDAEWAKSLPEFLKQSETPETRDALTGMADNLIAFSEAVTSPEVARLRDEGDVDRGITGYKQSSAEFMKYPGYYIASGIGELPYMYPPMASVRVSSRVMAAVVRITNKPGLKPSFLSATSRLERATNKLKKSITVDKKQTAKDLQNAMESRTKIKDVTDTKHGTGKAVKLAEREFEHFTKTEIKTRESTINELKKQRKAKNLSKEETEFIDKTIFDEQKTITQRQAELALVKKNLTNNKDTLKKAKDIFDKAEIPTKGSSEKVMRKYAEKRITYLKARESYMDSMDKVVSRRFDFSKKRSYEKIKTSYNAFRSEEKAKLQLKILKLKKKRDGYTTQKFGLNKFQLEQIKNLEDTMVPPAEKTLISTPGKPKLKTSKQLAEDKEMAEFIKKQNSLQETRFVPGELGDDVIASVSKVKLEPDTLIGPRSPGENVFVDGWKMKPGKGTIQEKQGPYQPGKNYSKYDKKINKLQTKIDRLENNQIPLYEKIAVGLEELPYKGILPLRMAYAGKTPEQETKKVYDETTNAYVDSTPTTAEKIMEVLKIPKEKIGAAYVRKEQAIANMVEGHLRLPNRVYVQDAADPSKGTVVLDMSKSDFIKFKEKMSDIDTRISNAEYPDEATALRQQKIILERELQQTAKTVDVENTYVPKQVYTKDGKSYNVIDPEDAFRDGRVPQLEVIDTANPTVRVTQGLNKGEWNIYLDYADELVKKSEGKIAPLDIAGTAFYRPRKDISVDMGRTSVENLKGKELFFTLTAPEDRVLGIGNVFRGQKYTRSGPVVISKGEDMNLELIKELGLEPEPMMQTIGQESVLSFAGLSKRNFRKLFRKKKAPIREAKQYEGKGVYMMIDPSKFGNRVDNAWQKYAESYMTDSEAGAVRIRYDKDGITINTTVKELFERRMLYQSRGSEVFQERQLKLEALTRDANVTMKLLQEEKDQATRDLNAMNKPFENKVRMLEDSIDARKSSIAAIQADLKEGKQNIVVSNKAVPVKIYKPKTKEHEALERNIAEIEKSRDPTGKLDKKTGYTEQMLVDLKDKLRDEEVKWEDRAETVWQYEKTLGFKEESAVFEYGWDPKTGLTVPWPGGIKLSTGRVNPDGPGPSVPMYFDESGNIRFAEQDVIPGMPQVPEQGYIGKNPLWPFMPPGERIAKTGPGAGIIAPDAPYRVPTGKIPTDKEGVATGTSKPLMIYSQTLTPKQATQLIKREKANIKEAQEVLEAMKKYGIHSSMAYQGEKYKGLTGAAMMEYKREQGYRKLKRQKLIEEIEEAKQDLGKKQLETTLTDAEKGEINKVMDNIESIEAGLYADKDSVMEELTKQDLRMQSALQNKKISQSEYDDWSNIYEELWLSYDNPQYLEKATISVLEDFDRKITRKKAVLEKQANDPGRLGNFDSEFELRYYGILNVFEDVVGTEITKKRNRKVQGLDEVEPDLGTPDPGDLSIRELKQKVSALESMSKKLGSMYDTPEKRKLGRAVEIDQRKWKATTDDNDYQVFLHDIDLKKKKIAELEVLIERKAKDVDTYTTAKKRVNEVAEQWDGFREKYKEVRGFSPGIPRGKVIEFTETALKKEGIKLVDAKSKPLLEQSLFMRLPDGQVITKGTIISEKGQDKIDLIVEKARERAAGAEEKYGIDILDVSSGLNFSEMRQINKIRKDNSQDTVFIFKNEDEMLSNPDKGLILTKEHADKIEFGNRTDEIMKLVKTDKEYPMEYGMSRVGKFKLNISRRVKNDREAASQIFGMIKKSHDERMAKIPRGVGFDGGELKFNKKPIAENVYPDEGINFAMMGGRERVQFRFDQVSQSWVSIEAGKPFGVVPGRLTREKMSTSWAQDRNMEISRLLADSNQFQSIGEIRSGTRAFTVYEHSPTIEGVPGVGQPVSRLKGTPQDVPENIEGIELYRYLKDKMNPLEQAMFDTYVRKQYSDFVARTDGGKVLTKEQRRALPNVRDVETDIIAKIDSDLFRSSTVGERKKIRAKKNKAVFDTEAGDYVTTYPETMNISIADKKGIIDARAIFRAVKGIEDTDKPGRGRAVLTYVSQKIGRGSPDIVSEGVYEYAFENASRQNMLLEGLRKGLEEGNITIKQIQKTNPELLREGEDGLVLKGTIEMRPEVVQEYRSELLSPRALTLDNADADTIKQARVKLTDVENDLLDKRVTQYLDDIEYEYQPDASGLPTIGTKTVAKPGKSWETRHSTSIGVEMVQKQRGYEEILLQINKGDVQYTMNDLYASIRRLKSKKIIKEVAATEAYTRREKPVSIIISDSKITKYTNKIKEYDAILRSNPSDKMRKHIQKLRDKKEGQLAELKDEIANENFILDGSELITWHRNRLTNSWEVTKRSKLQMSKDKVVLQKVSDETYRDSPYDIEGWRGFNESWNKPGADQLASTAGSRRQYEIAQLEREHERLTGFLKGEGSLAGRADTDEALGSMLGDTPPPKGTLTKKVTVWRGDKQFELEVDMVETDTGIKIDYSSLSKANDDLNRMVRKTDPEAPVVRLSEPKGEAQLKENYQVINPLEFEDELIRTTMATDPAVGPTGPLAKWTPGDVEGTFFKSTWVRPKPKGAEQIYKDTQLELRLNYGIGEDINTLSPTKKMRKLETSMQLDDEIPKIKTRIADIQKKYDSEKNETKKSLLLDDLKSQKKALSQSENQLSEIEKAIAKDYDANIQARKGAIKTIDTTIKRKPTNETPGALQAYGVPTTNVLQAAYAEEQKGPTIPGIQIPRPPAQETERPFDVVPSTLVGITKGFEAMSKQAQGSSLGTELSSILSGKSGWREGQWERLQEGQLQEYLKKESLLEAERAPTLFAQSLIQRAGLRDRLREDERQLITPINQEFLQARQRNYQNFPPVTPQIPVARQIPIGPGFIAPMWETPQDRYLRTKRKKTKSKKIYWEVPEYWFQPGYWGGKNQMGPGYRVFKGREPKKIRRKDKRKNLD